MFSTIIVRLNHIEDESKSKTLSASVRDSFITLRKQWVNDFGGDPTSICLRTKRMEFLFKDDQPVGSLLTEDTNILELTVEELTTVTIEIIGFPNISNFCLEIPLTMTPTDFARLLCYRLRLPDRKMQCHIRERLLDENVPFTEQGVSKDALISCDLQFHMIIERNKDWSDDLQNDTYECSCYGSDPVNCLLPDSTTQYRFLYYSQPIMMNVTVSEALTDHGGLRRWHWVLQLEKQLSVEVLYPPPRGWINSHVWPTDQVSKLLDDGGTSILLENKRLDPKATFQELKITTNTRLWIAKVIHLKIENTRGVIRDLAIPDSSTIEMLRKEVATMEPTSRFYFQYDNSWLSQESRLLHRCGVTDGSLIKLIRRQIAVILAFQGNHYSLGYIDTELEYEELLEMASNVLETPLDQRTSFECATCKRSVSVETKAQRQLPAACCEVAPRLLRVHCSMDIKLQVSMSSDPQNTVDQTFNQVTSSTMHDLMGYVTDQVQRERNLAEDEGDFGVPLSEVLNLHDCVSLKIIAEVHDNKPGIFQQHVSAQKDANVSHGLSRITWWWWDILSWFRSHDNSEARPSHSTCNVLLEEEYSLNMNENKRLREKSSTSSIETDFSSIRENIRRKFSHQEGTSSSNRRTRRFSTDKADEPSSSNKLSNGISHRKRRISIGEAASSDLFNSALDVTLSRDTKIVEKYLQTGGNVNSILSDGTTLLAVATMSGNEESLNILLDSGAAVNGVCSDGLTSLHIAAYSGNVNMVQRLLDAGASIDIRFNNEYTPLLLAIKKHHTDVVKLLLSRGAYPNAVLSDGISGLYLAARFALLQCVQDLIAHGADVNIARRTGATPLFIAAQSGYTDIAQFLIRNSAEIDKPMKNGATALYIACQNGHWGMVSFLIDSNANVDASMENGATPLFSAAQNGHIEILTLLIRNNAQVNISCKDGTTPLFVASQNGHCKIVRKLIDSGADINVTCDNGASSLYIACQNGHDDIAQLLIEEGADMNACCTDGSTAAYVAAQNGYSDIIQLLIDYGADVHKARKDKVTPFSIARQQRHTEVLHLLGRSGPCIQQ